VTRYI